MHIMAVQRLCSFPERDELSPDHLHAYLLHHPYYGPGVLNSEGPGELAGYPHPGLVHVATIGLMPEPGTTTSLELKVLARLKRPGEPHCTEPRWEYRLLLGRPSHNYDNLESDLSSRLPYGWQSVPQLVTFVGFVEEMTEYFGLSPSPDEGLR